MKAIGSGYLIGDVPQNLPLPVAVPAPIGFGGNRNGAGSYISVTSILAGEDLVQDLFWLADELFCRSVNVLKIERLQGI